MTRQPLDVHCRAIGLVRSRFTSSIGMPIQTVAAPDEPGRVEVFAEYAPGLKDVEGFDHLILLTHLHLAANERLEVVPFMDDQPRGVFATRAPTRPNRIGLSIVRLLRVEGTVLHFSGNDMLDGTPVLDIKPYVPQLDVRAGERIGWFEQGLRRLATPSDRRME